MQDFPQGVSSRRLLGTDLAITRSGDDFTIPGAQVRTDYDHLWVTSGTPERFFDMPESREPDRRAVYCGAVRVRASGLRLIENFLDLAHFPYVHTDILGTEAKPEVAKHDVEQRRDVDELWATKCEFFQPKAAASSEGG